MSDIQQHLAVSQKVEIDDLDWDLARTVGLTQNEITWLHHIADVESQTVHYFLEVAKLQVSRDPELLTFLTMWNYEEYFHAYALTRVMKECGVKVVSASERAQSIRKGARIKAKVEDYVQQGMAKAMPTSFVALWMTWGAMQECLTMQAYETLATITPNPILQEVCRRIAKQERRHFAYYFGQARDRLATGSNFTRKYVRFICDKFFSPVGSGVKTEEELAAFMNSMLPGETMINAFGYVDKKMSSLPGMENFTACSRYARATVKLVETPALVQVHAA